MIKKIRIRKWLKIAAAVLLALLLLTAGISFFYPDVSKLKKENPKKTAFMEYRENEWRRQGKKKRITHLWVPFSAISPYAVKAVIIAEDDKFWQHEGFDFEAMAIHLLALEKTARANGTPIVHVIFDPVLQPKLFATPSGAQLARRGLAFSQYRAWVRHDEHYHVNFAVRCN